MALQDEIAADFALEELEEDLFHSATWREHTIKLMVSDTFVEEEFGEGGTKYSAKIRFKFRQSDLTTLGESIPAIGDTITFNGEKYDVYSVNYRSGKALIPVEAKLRN